MFPKSQKISKKSPIFKEKSGFFGLYNRITIKNSLNLKPKIAIVVSKKVASRAVDRNKIKRVIYHHLRPKNKEFLNKEIVVFIKSGIPEKHQILLDDIEKTLINGLKKAK